MANLERITADPDVPAGKPIIKGTRLSVEFIVNLMAQGWPEEELIRDYPGIEIEDGRACLACTSDVLHAEKAYSVGV
ncbi:MAG TPA: DUF433 domain-containing protein [Candidatus Hydrogenedentes bacterium]|nr:DUF433 domain-containing protein [Candidatus Hydrogenedentota bacterium]